MAFGDPVASCVSCRDADFAPSAPGANVTVRSVCDPAVIAPDVGVTVKSAALVPVIVAPLMLSVAVPVFCTVSVAFTDPPVVTVPRPREPATEITGSTSPVPVNDMASGLVLSLCVSVRVADFSPAEEGENVTVTSALPPADTLTELGVAEY